MGNAVVRVAVEIAAIGVLRVAALALERRRKLELRGYTQSAIVHGGRLDPGVELLSKPYTRDDLARKVRLTMTKQQRQRS
jgi:hypothetical protein